MHRWSRPSTKGGTDHLPSPNRVRNRAYLWPLAKFAPQIRNWRDRDLSVFRASHGQLFPFLAMDVKCGQVGLDLADRQNAHSSAIAARAIVSFFRIAGREKDLHRRIVCWSISHNNRSVLIYGYYTVIDSEHTSYYTHLHNGHFISPQITNETRWTSYKFVKNLYEKWVPDHLDKVRSLLDGLPYPPVQPTSDRRFQAGGARDVKTGGGGRSAGQPPSRTKKKKEYLPQMQPARFLHTHVIMSASSQYRAHHDISHRHSSRAATPKTPTPCRERKVQPPRPARVTRRRPRPWRARQIAEKTHRPSSAQRAQRLRRRPPD